MFINRKYELEKLEEKFETFLNWNWQNTFHLAFLGLRRTWKTYLLTHFLQKKKKFVKTVYFNVSKFKVSPYSFSMWLIETFLKALYWEKENIFEEIDDLNILKKIKSIENLFKEKKIDFAINKTFELINYVSDEKWKFIVVLDEFQDFFAFENYPQLKNIEAIFRDNLEKSLNIFYIISGSFPSILKEILNNPKHYIYSYFEIIDIYNFDKQNTKKLVKYIRKDLWDFDIENIFKLTNWNPYLVVNVVNNMEVWEDLNSLVSKYLFNSNWKIYNYFLYILEESLNKIPWETSLVWALKEVAFADWITLTEISNEIKLDIAVVNKSIKLLKKVDLVYVDLEKKWYIENYIFKFFLKYYFLWIDDFEYIKSSFLEKKLKLLQEEFALISTELWKTKEFELYYEIKENGGKIWENIKLPKFKILQKNYFTTIWDELDLYAETFAWKKWVFELKYKKKNIWEKEIEKFLQKIEADKYVYISKSWFTKGVLEKYQNNKKVFLVEI